MVHFVFGQTVPFHGPFTACATYGVEAVVMYLLFSPRGNTGNNENAKPNEESTAVAPITDGGNAPDSEGVDCGATVEDKNQTQNGLPTLLAAMPPSLQKTSAETVTGLFTEDKVPATKPVQCALGCDPEIVNSDESDEIDSDFDSSNSARRSMMLWIGAYCVFVGFSAPLSYWAVLFVFQTASADWLRVIVLMLFDVNKEFLDLLSITVLDVVRKRRDEVIKWDKFERKKHGLPESDLHVPTIPHSSIAHFLTATNHASFLSLAIVDVSIGVVFVQGAMQLFLNLWQLQFCQGIVLTSPKHLLISTGKTIASVSRKGVQRASVFGGNLRKSIIGLGAGGKRWGFLPTAMKLNSDERRQRRSLTSLYSFSSGSDKISSMESDNPDGNPVNDITVRIQEDSTVISLTGLPSGLSDASPTCYSGRVSATPNTEPVGFLPVECDSPDAKRHNSALMLETALPQPTEEEMELKAAEAFNERLEVALALVANEVTEIFVPLAYATIHAIIRQGPNAKYLGGLSSPDVSIWHYGPGPEDVWVVITNLLLVALLELIIFIIVIVLAYKYTRGQGQDGDAVVQTRLSTGEQVDVDAATAGGFNLLIALRAQVSRYWPSITACYAFFIFLQVCNTAVHCGMDFSLGWEAKWKKDIEGSG